MVFDVWAVFEGMYQRYGDLYGGFMRDRSFVRSDAVEPVELSLNVVSETQDASLLIWLVSFRLLWKIR